MDGVREGNGLLKYNNGNKYKGEFMTGLFHGFGVYEYAECVESGVKVRGRRYEGRFSKGRREGEGIFFSGTGEMYEGKFKADLYHGYGTLTKRNGDR